MAPNPPSIDGGDEGLAANERPPDEVGGSAGIEGTGGIDGSGRDGDESVDSGADGLPVNVPSLADLAIPKQPSSVASRGASNVALLGSASDAKKKYGKMMVAKKTAINPSAFEKVEVLVPKERRGPAGSKTYSYYMAAATKPLESKFGVASHHVTGSEVEEGDQTKSMYVQEANVMNLTKLEDASKRGIQYDWKEILMVPKDIINAVTNDPSEIFSFEDHYLLEAWDDIEWDVLCRWQFAVNFYMGEEQQTSNKWCKVFFEESCTHELRELIAQDYDNLPPELKGGITYVYLMCRKVFALNREIVDALKSFLKLFKNKGLKRLYKGENVTLAQKQIMAVVRRLHGAGELPKETPIDVLEGLRLCSVQEFSDLFDSFLQDAKKESLISGMRHSRRDAFLETKVILHNAWQTFDTMCTAKKWNVPKGHKFSNVSSNGNRGGGAPRDCWNCEKPGCNARTCPEKRDEARIARNRKKYFDAKEASGGGSGGGVKQQERSKWGEGKTNQGARPAIKWIDGAPHAYCGKQHAPGKTCGWTKDHSAKYHSQWAAEGASFDLAKVSPNHGLVLAWRNMRGGGGSGGAPPPGSSTGGAMAGTAAIRRKLEMLEDNVTGEEARTVLAAIKEVFG
jgi:hypothetical protein